MEGVCSNSTAYIVKKKGPKGSNEREDYVGSRIECALLEYMEKLGYDYNQVRRDALVEKRWPFSPTNKSMSTAMARSKNGRHVLHTKGAAEMILSICTRILDDNGLPIPLSKELAVSTIFISNVTLPTIHSSSSHVSICLLYYI